MNTIIATLRIYQKSLNKQFFELPEESDSNEDEIWKAEVGAKLEIVEELLEKFDKKKKNK